MTALLCCDPPGVRVMGAVDRRQTIIVGGDHVGLSAAYELRRLGVDCLALEAQPRARE